MRAGRTARDRLGLAALAGIVGLLAVWPLLRLAFEAVAPGGTLDLGAFRRLFASDAVERAFWGTIETSLWSTALSVLLGGGFALLIALSDLRRKAALTFLFMLPLVVPSQITALAWINLLGANSAFLQWIGLAPAPGTPHPMFGAGGIVFLLGIEHAPYVFLALAAALRALPRELIEAARMAGARRGKAIRSVVLPLALPALAAGAVLAFIASLGNFGTPALLGIPANYPTLATLIYQRLSGFGPAVLGDVAALSLLVAAIAALALWLNGRLARGRDVRVEGGGAPALAFRLGRARAPIAAALWAALILVVVVPALSLVAASLVPAVGVPLTWKTATLAGYGEALFRQAAIGRAFVNSFALSAAAALVAVALAVPLARAIAWRPGRVARALDLVVDLPYALPGLVLGIAFVLVFLKPLPLVGVSLYGTVWIILLAYVARFLALALRPVLAGMAQIDPALDEAAAAAGARPGRRMRTILLPMLAPAAAAGGLLVFLTALNELTVSALLWSSGAETLGVIVYSLQEGGDSPAAAAVSVVAIVVVLALMLAANGLARRLPPGALPWRA
jgi:iron(III) transport system permease protein